MPERPDSAAHKGKTMSNIKGALLAGAIAMTASQGLAQDETIKVGVLH